MSTQDDAATLVSMPVADLAGHLDGMDMETLTAALELEQAREGGPRKGALAALQAAIDGHPENAADAAAAADELEDIPGDPNAVSVAPPRVHQSLIDQLELRWIELKYFVKHLEGDEPGELGEVLAFVRSKL